MDAVRAQALSSIQGIAPDGTDVNLIIHEASRGHLSVLGETDLRVHGPQCIPGPSLMKSFTLSGLSVSSRLCPWENQPVVTNSVMGSLFLCTAKVTMDNNAETIPS